MHDKILKLKAQSAICKNQDVLDEIVDFIHLNAGKDKLFLRHTVSPIEDIEVGFSASHFMQDPYANTLSDAEEIMQSNEKEDDYFIFRQLEWNNNSNYKQSKLYNNHLKTPCLADTCPSVHDHRKGKVIVNPEFGLSSYLILETDDTISTIKKIISECYMYKEADLKDWHLFKSKHYHHNDSDSLKDGLLNSDRIVCMLNARHIISIERLFELTLSNKVETGLTA